MMHFAAAPVIFLVNNCNYATLSVGAVPNLQEVAGTCIPSAFCYRF